MTDDNTYQPSAYSIRRRRRNRIIGILLLISFAAGGLSSVNNIF